MKGKIQIPCNFHPILFDIYTEVYLLAVARPQRVVSTGRGYRRVTLPELPRGNMPEALKPFLKEGPRFDHGSTRRNRTEIMPKFLGRLFRTQDVQTFVTSGAGPLTGIGSGSRVVPPIAQEVLAGLHDPDAEIFDTSLTGARVLFAEEDRNNRWLAIGIPQLNGKIDIYLAVREGEKGGATVYRVSTEQFREMKRQDVDYYWALLRKTAIDYADIQFGTRRYEELATDRLTGLVAPNARSGAIEKAFEKDREDKRPFGLLLVDLNGFKRINDERGHAAGDAILREAGRAIRESFPREDDVKIRWGGDEFVVMVRGIRDSADLERLVKRLITSTTVQMSVGATFWAQGGAERVEEVVEQADRAMYVAKAAAKKVNGRSQYHIAAGGMILAGREMAPGVDESARTSLRIQPVSPATPQYATVSADGFPEGFAARINRSLSEALDDAIKNEMRTADRKREPIAHDSNSIRLNIRRVSDPRTGVSATHIAIELADTLHQQNALGGEGSRSQMVTFAQTVVAQLYAEISSAYPGEPLKVYTRSPFTAEMLAKGVSGAAKPRSDAPFMRLVWEDGHQVDLNSAQARFLHAQIFSGMPMSGEVRSAHHGLSRAAFLFQAKAA